jgi:hypothetical protein
MLGDQLARDSERLQSMNAKIQRPATGDNGHEFSEGPLDQELEFLWKDGGPSGKAYDLYLGRISRNPVVRSHATGKYFMLPWSQIIELAVETGLDEK